MGVWLVLTELKFCSEMAFPPSWKRLMSPRNRPLNHAFYQQPASSTTPPRVQPEYWQQTNNRRRRCHSVYITSVNMCRPQFFRMIKCYELPERRDFGKVNSPAVLGCRISSALGTVLRWTVSRQAGSGCKAGSGSSRSPCGRPLSSQFFSGRSFEHEPSTAPMFYVWLVVWLPFFIFPYIGNVIIPIDFHIFQRVKKTTNQMFFWTNQASDLAQLVRGSRIPRGARVLFAATTSGMIFCAWSNWVAHHVRSC